MSARVAGLFAGVGGLELGLHDSGFRTELLCEIEPAAQKVLRARFPDVALVGDVRTLKALPRVEVVAAGFPCQDLSQAGGKRGIRGAQSGLVGHLLRLLRRARPRPTWVVMENVSYMLRLHQGQAMRYLTQALEELGYRWAYRVVDARAFGLPQRRLRVILVASRDENPCDVLFADNVSDPALITRRLQAPLVVDELGPERVERAPGKSYGFYWTEGRIGIGWTQDAIPPIKGGSTLGIASPPAVWVPATNAFGVPSIRDGERLQGFPSGWTEAAAQHGAKGVRWKLVGNAICAKVSGWVGERLVSPGRYVADDEDVWEGGVWPLAGYGRGAQVRAPKLTVWPVVRKGPVLTRFLDEPLRPMSRRAAEGFLGRARATPKIRYAPEFLSALATYVRTAPEGWPKET